LGPDVDGAGHRVGPGQLSANIVQPRHGGPDLAWLAQRRDFNDQRVFLAGQLESSQQICDLSANLGADRLLPALRSREELPKPLGYLSPNFLGFQHLSLAPTISASAETIRTIESACQAKTYRSELEQ
jgi:hypothetical protein